jgi:hypothetical protein
MTIGTRLGSVEKSALPPSCGAVTPG